MFDTVTFVRDAGHVDPHGLLARGWTRQTTTKPDGTFSDKFYLNEQTEEVSPRLTWYESGYLTAEVSLPKLLNGQNVELIHQVDLPEAFEKVGDFVGSKADVDVDMSSWALSRCDFCYCWKVDDLLPHYLQALSRLHLSRHNRQSVDGSSLTFHSKANKLLLYDKHKESKLDIAKGVLRAEVAIRDTHYLAKKWLKTERTAGAMLTDDGSKQVLEYFLDRLGLADAPILPELAYRDALVHQFGVKMAGDLLLFSWLYEQYSSGLVGWLYPRRTYYHYRKQLKDAGLLTFCKADTSLPALVID